MIESLSPNTPREVPRIEDRRVLNGTIWRPRTGAPSGGGFKGCDAEIQDIDSSCRHFMMQETPHSGRDWGAVGSAELGAQMCIGTPIDYKVL